MYKRQLSNLDAKLRVSMRNEISKLHRNLGSTTIYVTHDQVEAMTMADRIVIMKDGVIQQVGKPMELYDHPVNKFVAGFIGSPQMNFFDVTLKGNEVTFEDGNKLMLPEAILKKLNGKEGEMTLGIRGEDLKMDAQNLELYKENKMKAVITDTESWEMRITCTSSSEAARQLHEFLNMRSARLEMKLNLYLCHPRFISLIKKLR